MTTLLDALSRRIDRAALLGDGAALERLLAEYARRVAWAATQARRQDEEARS